MEVELDSIRSNELQNRKRGLSKSGVPNDKDGGNVNRAESQQAKYWEDEAVLARFGKKQQLKRRFKSLSTIGLTCSIMLTWEVTLFDLEFGLFNGGPAGVIWGFLGAWIGTIFQALVMAEMASMIPLAGGAFNWVSVLSPPSARKFLSYVAGWLTIIYLQCYVATVCFTCASTLSGVVILNYPAPIYEPQLWHTTLIYYAILAFALFVNTYLGRLLPQFEASGLIFYTLTFFGVLISVTYLSSHRSASDVFGTFQNLGGYSSNGVAFLVGWITSFGSFTGVESSNHIAEEVGSAANVVPLTMWVSTMISGALGFGIVVAMMFATPDFVQAAESPTGFPFIDIFSSAMGTQGATALAGIMITSNILSAGSVLATASRSLWAFSRENGVPFSKLLAKVDTKTRLPYNAIIASIIFNVLIGLISLGSTAAFEAFVSAVVSAYHMTVLFATSVLLHKRLTTPSTEIPWGPFKLGKFGIPINIACVAYTTVVTIFSFFPDEVPVTPSGMNYSSAIYGGSILVMVLSWLFHGRKIYVGPIWELDEQWHRVAPRNSVI